MAHSVVIALGSNLGDRRLNLRRAVHGLRLVMSVVRLSSIHETEPVDAPLGSPAFLNMVLAGQTPLEPEALMSALLAIEAQLGRRRGMRNAPRTIDLDLILHGAHLRGSPMLTLPHPRYRDRAFVMVPLAELGLPWRDPRSGKSLPVRVDGGVGAGLYID